MKNLINVNSIFIITKAIKELYPIFDEEKFIEQASTGLLELELKERVIHVAKILHIYLPKDYLSAQAILRKIPTVWIMPTEKAHLHGFTAWPIIDYVALYGLNYPKISAEILKELTPLFTAEFAIRPFIIHHQEMILPIFHEWVLDENEHVRRLVSEGLRPRLPWGEQLKKFIVDPSPIFPFLSQLKYDESEYVRRSVANNLNDISKDHPDKVIEICSQWLSEAKTDSNKIKIKKLVTHALRSLVKSGKKEVFRLLGYTDEPQVSVSELHIDKAKLSIGGDLIFTAKLSSDKPNTRFVLDYAIHFMKANGKTSPKVFKLKNCCLNTDSPLYITKKHSFKKISTRIYHPGRHLLVLHVNGKALAEAEFYLEHVGLRR